VSFVYEDGIITSRPYIAQNIAIIISKKKGLLICCLKRGTVETRSCWIKGVRHRKFQHDIAKGQSKKR